MQTVLGTTIFHLQSAQETTCRAAFWEFVRAPEFSGHKKAKRVFLGFDIFFALGILATFILTAAVFLSPDGSGYDILQLVLDCEFLEALGFGFPWIIVGSYILVVVGALYARRWARAASIYSPVTNAMFAVMWPVLLAQTLFRIVLLVLYLIAFISETGQGDAAFYLSIPWRAQQIAVLGVLAWVLYTKPVRVDEDRAQTLVDHHPDTKTVENVDRRV
ncbi:hypothetical protein EXIGLDRAFT_724077 [Exidia glandulosa HHB12029]|uniref:Uncharacterized protein n=1 Tax=Exidia glandulosa HHB12029 TaxID=1314781 RepID=A0A165EK53_EXIGL|nr:hypothetical protein EXIGLDRAFT_724077 [Exidia glandulosa HHB12029]